jgi:uncharacterized membrane protein
LNLIGKVGESALFRTSCYINIGSVALIGDTLMGSDLKENVQKVKYAKWQLFSLLFCCNGKFELFLSLTKYSELTLYVQFLNINIFTSEMLVKYFFVSKCEKIFS